MLKISGRRKKDNYHLLHSLFTYIDLYDIITILPNNNEGTSLFIKGPHSSSFDNYNEEEINKNLISKVLRLFADEFHINPNFHIVLTKNIPIKAGMGGGSSNAAAVARFLNKYYNLKLSNQRLVELITPLGTDIPFFLQPSMAFCEGIGELVTPMPLPELNNLVTVIVYPSFSLPSPQVFKALNYKSSVKDNALIKQIEDFKNNINNFTLEGLIGQFSHFDNDLVEASSKLFFEIKELIDTMKAFEGVKYASMSGSGSACFALCDNDFAAQLLVSRLQERFRSYKIYITNILTQIEHEKVSPSARPCYHKESHDSIPSADTFYLGESKIAA